MSSSCRPSDSLRKEAISSKSMLVYVRIKHSLWQILLSSDTDDDVVLMGQKIKNFPACETCTVVNLDKVLVLPHSGAFCSSDICPLQEKTGITHYCLIILDFSFIIFQIYAFILLWIFFLSLITAL